jgi:hypothetical protein
MKMLQTLRRHCRLLALVAFWVQSVFPLLAAQNPKDLMTDVCNNELQQRKHIALWASQVERRTAGHVYREEEIETVDGPIYRLLSVDSREPSPSERKRDDDRLRDLRENPQTQSKLKKDREAEEQKLDNLLRVIPDAFLFEDQGKQGDLEKLKFRPNPAYKPATYEEAALHAISGTVLIDLRERRLAQVSGTLARPVNFGYGLVGHLNQGGVIEVVRIGLSPGVWRTSLLRIDLDGRFALFKKVSRHLDETHSDFELVPPDTNIQRALERIVRKSAIISSLFRYALAHLVYLIAFLQISTRS